MSKKKSIIIIVVSILIISSLLIICNYYDKYEEELLIDDYISDTTSTNSITTSKRTKKTTILKIIKTTKKVNYSFILEVPKINLKKGIYSKDNKDNNVDKNITILSTSDMPEKENGTVILASHNGNTKVSYFKNLEKLKENDQVYIYYKGIKYIYKIYKYEVVDKIGNIKVNKKSNKSTIALISCKNGTNDKQIIYLGELINRESY